MNQAMQNQKPGLSPELERPDVRCPFCHSPNTQCEAAFGTTHAYAQFYCRACRTPFEWIKWEEHAPANDLPPFLRS